jgi:tRNA pseudouridine55 synthase
VVATRPVHGLTEAAVLEALSAFVGDLDQVPSAVSAVKLGGKPAYARVRAGEEVVLPARRVTIHALDVTGVDLPDVGISVHCSTGTYIRAVARDLGAALGVGGHLTRLRRTAVGPFSLEDARTLDDLTDHLAVTPIAEAARASFPARDLDEAQAAQVRVGRRLDIALGATTALFAPGGEFLALYRAGEDGRAKAVAVLCEAPPSSG